ncbi:MAG: protein TolR [Alphaproteobacteria bacterium]|jgi:biopolymer transport protein TolR|nr:protein TolR [Alphaproteobacteria bacterium]MBO6862271.1 protein TolR [Alphaproteobacteria bacterium]MEC9266095.1 protein TolR [Pseudomonadota bacterium]
MGAHLDHSGIRPGLRRKRYRPVSEINVTPFVDVMLVLLIVFMVTAPLLSVGVPVDLPKTEAATLNDSDEPLIVTVNKDGDVFLDEEPTDLPRLVATLVATHGANPDIRVFVRGDASIQYGRVMEVMGQISAAGFKKVALLAKLPDAQSSKAQ